MVKDKRGDIPVTILVLGVFVICALALLSFYASSIKLSNASVGIDLMEKMNSNINEYNFYNSHGFSEEQIKNFMAEDDFYFLEDGFVINKTQTAIKPQLAFDWTEEEFLFSVKFYKD